MAQVTFSVKATSELSQSVLYYEMEQIGLGSRFKNQVDIKLDFIELHPNSFTKKKNGLREILIDDFPYSIIYDYKPSKELIVVASIFHNKRNPMKKFKK
jgi:plasmid stabilization system protein ParE